MRFDLQKGLPLLTTKKIHLKSVIHELLWFLQGNTNVAYLQQNGVRIWNEWATETGDLGPVYGKQWRAWPTTNSSGETIDQISSVIDKIKTAPHSRRLIVSAWNVADLPDESLSPQDNVHQGKMALAPCHAFFQFYVQKPQRQQNGSGGPGKATRPRLSCLLYQRSCDVFLGLGFNLASYSILTHMIADQCDLDIGEFIWTGGDVHIYKNHFEQVQLQLSRETRPLPQLLLKRRPPSIFDYKEEDFELVGYDPHPAIKAPISI